MRKYLLIATLIFLSSCTTARFRMLENSGVIKTDFSKDPEYDYDVIMQGSTFMGWDGNNKEDRRNTLLSMFGDRCKQLKIGDEVSAHVGAEQAGKPIPTWVMKVKCIK